MKKKKAFTLVELLVTMVIGILVLGGILLSLIKSMILSEYSEKFAIAMNIARAKIETIYSQRSSDYAGIISTDEALTLAADGLDGRCRVDVIEIPIAELKQIKVLVCWRGRGNAIVGDCNSGLTAWDPAVTGPAGEYNSPCEIEAAVARR